MTKLDTGKKRITLPHKPLGMAITCRFLFFIYKEVPGEYHVTCIETGSFGVGPTPDRAAENLAESIGAQLEENLRSGVLLAPIDPEWEAAWKQRKIASCEEAVVIAQGVGEVEIEVLKKSVKAEIDRPIRIDPKVVRPDLPQLV